MQVKMDVTNSETTMADDVTDVSVTSEVITSMTSSVTGDKMAMVVILAVIAMVNFSGNTLVIVSFMVEKKIRSRFNMFILNLAVTDMLVSLTCTFYTIDLLTGFWPFSEVLCGVWIFFDWGMTFLSIFTLLAISLDRYWAACYSVHYRAHNTRKKNIIFLMLTWLTMLTLWVPPFILDRMRWSIPHSCVWAVAHNRHFVLFVAIAGYHGPSVLMIACYIQVYRAMRRSQLAVGVAKSLHHAGSSITGPSVIEHISQNLAQPESTGAQVSNHTIQVTHHLSASNEVEVTSQETKGPTQPHNGTLTARQATQPAPKRSNQKSDRGYLDKEKKIFVSLTYILACYLICWTPWHVIFDVLYVDETLISTDVYAVGCIFCYLNSTINPFLYAYSNRDFREAFKKVLTLRFINWRLCH